MLATCALVRINPSLEMIVPDPHHFASSPNIARIWTVALESSETVGIGFGVGKGVFVGSGVAVVGATVGVAVGGTTSTGAPPQAIETISKIVNEIRKRLLSGCRLFIAILPTCKKLNLGMLRSAIRLH